MVAMLGLPWQAELPLPQSLDGGHAVQRATIEVLIVAQAHGLVS